MYDRQVRRRRAVLLALIVCCLVLVTAYFGESSGGPLKSVQTGAMEVLAPIQEGANKALKPLRDLFGWFGDTLVAKVKTVSDGNAVVMLLSDADFGVSARALQADQPGIALPIPGARNELLFDLVPSAKKVREGDRIVTAGTITEDLPSPFPPDILIGTVRKVEGEG